MYVDEVRMCDGRRFQADGAATEKELLESKFKLPLCGSATVACQERAFQRFVSILTCMWAVMSMCR